AACGFMNDNRTSFTDKELATMMYNAANIYYNTSGNLQSNCIDPTVCGDPGTANLGGAALGWPWQECSEIVIDMCARGGKSDFFWDECNGNSTALLIATCVSQFQNFNWSPAVWNMDAVPILYGLSVAHASNIIQVLRTGFLIQARSSRPMVRRWFQGIFRRCGAGSWNLYNGNTWCSSSSRSSYSKYL
ncbi:hypothetical protein V3C99_002959, partial [Haemonchus contortus]